MYKWALMLPQLPRYQVRTASPRPFQVRQVGKVWGRANASVRSDLNCQPELKSALALWRLVAHVEATICVARGFADLGLPSCSLVEGA